MGVLESMLSLCLAPSGSTHYGGHCPDLEEAVSSLSSALSVWAAGRCPLSLLSGSAPFFSCTEVTTLGTGEVAE